jgi:hypothetical protein
VAGESVGETVGTDVVGEPVGTDVAGDIVGGLVAASHTCCLTGVVLAL